jgi:hypothetical protein
MGQLLDWQDIAEDRAPRFDRYVLERRDRAFAVLLSDGRSFVMHAVAEETQGLEGRRFSTVEEAERVLDRTLQRSSDGSGA